jgi:hypothetical protein
MRDLPWFPTSLTAAELPQHLPRINMTCSGMPLLIISTNLIENDSFHSYTRSLTPVARPELTVVF